MLSITGMTLEQFADLMAGLGYSAEKGERVKVKAVPEKPADAPVVDAPAVDDAVTVGETSETVAPAQTPAEEAPVEAAAEAAPADAAPVEMEVFYTFKWGGNRGANRGGNRGQRRQDGDAPQGKGRPQGKGKPRRDGGKGKRDGGNKPQSFSARPAKKEKPIDPDNPFAAALMGLKDTK